MGWGLVGFCAWKAGRRGIGQLIRFGRLRLLRPDPGGDHGERPAFALLAGAELAPEAPTDWEAKREAKVQGPPLGGFLVADLVMNLSFGIVVPVLE